MPSPPTELPIAPTALNLAEKTTDPNDTIV